MQQPGSFGSIVEDKDWVVRKIQEIERKLNEQAAAITGRTELPAW